jgi:hypothetical protein
LLIFLPSFTKSSAPWREKEREGEKRERERKREII